MTTACAIDADLAAILEHGAALVKVARNDKMPLGKAWNTLATTIADVIGEWLGQGYNLGLLCGSGNLIDVEYDDELGRQTLARMGLLDVETPTWASGRGEHRLFRLADTVPLIGWRTIGGAEIRLGGKPAQSVLPPSTHPSGRPLHVAGEPAAVQPGRGHACRPGGDAVKRHWNAAIVALTLIRIGQELGTDSPAARCIHDLLELLASVASILSR